MIVRTLVAAMALVAATQARAVEVRACGELRSTPLSDERNVQSGLLQAFAVVNTDSAPVTLTSVRLDLKKGGKTTDTRWLLEDDIARVVRQGPMVAAVATMIPSQFCNGAMLAGTTTAKSATLAPGEALVFLHQPFLWQGARDALNIAVVTVKDGVSSESLTEVRISGAVARTQALFPVAGRSYVAVAASLHTPHRWVAMEEFALDIAMLGKGGSTHRGNGTRMTDYVAFGQPVRAVANGKVVRVTSATPDNVAMLIRPGESGEAYLGRLVEAQNALIAKGIEAVLGNHVVIDHGNGEYSVYAHLKQGSPRVVLGQQVKAGETIGALGSSGNSTEPHLHFQMCDNADMNRCHALQPTFRGVRLPLELTPRTIQSGDIVETIDTPGCPCGTLLRQ